ncbi:branched-chain amino acid aminotransferase [Dolosicoccus paucivorans]
MTQPKDLDWANIGFGYRDTGKTYQAFYKDGQWEPGKVVESSEITLSVAANVFHYGQAIFEGLKAYRWKDGSIHLFRPELNAQRFTESAERLLMVPFPEDEFVKAVHEVVKANAEWVPPYGTNATLYIRPFLIGTGASVGLSPSEEYFFGIYVTPVGAYFKGGMEPTKFYVTEYDRAAPHGTGAAKTAANYAASLIAGQEAKAKGYSDALYLDAATHTKIEEAGAANFFGITKDKQFVTPKSPSILPSITKRSLLYLAEHHLNLDVIETDIFIAEADQLVEAGAMGTAAVISPISQIQYGDRTIDYGPNVGPITKELYDELTGIQFGERPAPEGWVPEVK